MNRLTKLGFLLAFLAFSSFTQAGGESRFGLKLRVDVDGVFHPTVRSIVIDGVLPGSPAAQAGLLAGDVITEMQGLKIAGAKADDLKAATSEPAGGILRMKVKRGQTEPREVTLTAAHKS